MFALIGAVYSFVGPGPKTALALDVHYVPHNWNAKPNGVGVGDQFRLIFLSSTTRDASSSSIDVYNSFIQDRAAAGHNSIRRFSSEFRVVGCTSSRNATANTETRSSDPGAKIYWLKGAKVADSYADFYDGSWDNEANSKNESGGNGPDTSLDKPTTPTPAATTMEPKIPVRAGDSDTLSNGRPNTGQAMACQLLCRDGPLSSDTNHLVSPPIPSTASPRSSRSSTPEMPAP